MIMLIQYDVCDSGDHVPDVSATANDVTITVNRITVFKFEI